MIGHLFQVRTRNVSAHARHYLAGLFSHCARKNMERFSEAIPGTKLEDLQHFLSDSPWACGPLWQWTGRQAAQLLGGGPATMLLIDESGFDKKGPKSAGVARQYNGRLGKVDNCQVGVFSALTHGPRAVLTGARLYLPREWVRDSKRCRQAGIPKAERVMRSKNQLAWELIEQAQRDNIPFGWVGFDSAYGRDQSLLLRVAGLGKSFVADVDHDQLVWTQRPDSVTRPVNLRESGAQAVDALWAQSHRSRRRYVLRRAENGKVKVTFWARRVWIWPPTGELPLELWLLVSRRANGELKYSLCHTLEELDWAQLARRQGQRYFIERAFEDGKSELGLGDYQARKWLAWHHHMALVGAAMVFALAERELTQGQSPLVSVRDVVEMVAWYFAEERTGEQVSASIHARHRRRERSMKNKARRDKKRRVP